MRGNGMWYIYVKRLFSLSQSGFYEDNYFCQTNYDWRFVRDTFNEENKNTITNPTTEDLLSSLLV